MPSVNMRQLRDTRQLKTWLEAGKVIELRERDRVIARIVPQEGARETPEWPDFSGRIRKIFKARKVPGADMVTKERGRY